MIFGSVTIFGILSWYFVPEHKWLRREVVLRGLHASQDGQDEGPELTRVAGGSGARSSTDTKVVD